MRFGLFNPILFPLQKWAGSSWVMNSARRIIRGLEECESNGLAVSFQNSGVTVPVKNIAEPVAHCHWLWLEVRPWPSQSTGIGVCDGSTLQHRETR